MPCLDVDIEDAPSLAENTEVSWSGWQSCARVGHSDGLRCHLLPNFQCPLRSIARPSAARLLTASPPIAERHAHCSPPGRWWPGEEKAMGHSEYDPAAKERRPWNAGRMVGAKRALKPQQVWAIRFWLDRERRLRDRALGSPLPLTVSVTPRCVAKDRGASQRRCRH